MYIVPRNALWPNDRAEIALRVGGPEFNPWQWHTTTVKQMVPKCFYKCLMLSKYM